MPYSEFLQELRSNNVKEVAIYDNEIQGVPMRARTDGRTVFVTTRVDRRLAADLEQYNVKFSGIVQSTLMRDRGSGLHAIHLHNDIILQGDVPSLQGYRTQAA